MVCVHNERLFFHVQLTYANIWRAQYRFDKTFVMPKGYGELCFELSSLQAKEKGYGEKA